MVAIRLASVSSDENGKIVAARKDIKNKDKYIKISFYIFDLPKLIFQLTYSDVYLIAF